VTADGVPGLEQLGGESSAERDDRTEPEVWEAGSRETGAPVLVGDEDVDAIDDEKDLVALASDPDATGPLSEDDEFSGDETIRDYATEREGPRSAEEAAIHVVEDVPGATS
jgi:hypothetical protein